MNYPTDEELARVPLVAKALHAYELGTDAQRRKLVVLLANITGATYPEIGAKVELRAILGSNSGRQTRTAKRTVTRQRAAKLLRRKGLEVSRD